MAVSKGGEVRKKKVRRGSRVKGGVVGEVRGG